MNTLSSQRPSATATRLTRLRNEIDRNGWSALLVTDLVDVRWITGFSSSNAAAIVTSSDAFVVTDFRYQQAASSLGAGIEPRVINQNLFGELGTLLGEIVGTGAVAYSPASLTHRSFLQLTEGLPDALTLRAVDGVIGTLRQVKDAGEIESVARASALLEGAYELVASMGLAGRTEGQVAWAIEQHLREAGATGLSFESIVASGVNGALPHHHPADDVIPVDTLVTVDIGCIFDGYCSDCTRTFAVGNPSDELRKIYQVTLDAQLASLDAVRPGAVGRDVDATARAIIEAAGYGERFGHGLGHGVGLEVHEGPRLSRPSNDVLEAGQLVTVEPGIYLPGVGGVRIEDLVVVTESGCDILTGYTKGLTQA